MDEIESAPVTAAPKPRVRARKTAARKPARRKRPVRWSAKRETLFLEALAGSANIALSCRAASLSESTVRRRKDKDEEFAARWAAALRDGFEKLETMLLDRALNGVEKSVWHGGRQVGTMTEYSDRLGLALLTAHRASVTGVKPTSADVSEEELRTQLARRLADMNLRMGGAG